MLRWRYQKSETQCRGRIHFIKLDKTKSSSRCFVVLSAEAAFVPIHTTVWPPARGNDRLSYHK